MLTFWYPSLQLLWGKGSVKCTFQMAQMAPPAGKEEPIKFHLRETDRTYKGRIPSVQIQAKARQFALRYVTGWTPARPSSCTAELRGHFQLWHSRTKPSRGLDVRVLVVIKASIVEHLPIGISAVRLGLSRFFYQNIVLCSPRVAAFILRTPEKQES